MKDRLAKILAGAKAFASRTIASLGLISGFVGWLVFAVFGVAMMMISGLFLMIPLAMGAMVAPAREPVQAEG